MKKGKKPYPGVTSYRDRHGVLRWRYRRAGLTVQLGTCFGSVDFLRRYEAAVAKTRAPAGERRHPPRSLGALVAAYKQTGEWAALKATTKRAYSTSLDPLVERYGKLPVAEEQFTAKHVDLLLAEYASRKTAGNNLRKRLHRIADLAVLLGWRSTNPVTATRAYRTRSEGIKAWTEAEIAAFFRRWQIGTTEHLAVSLMLETGASRADAVALGPANLEDGWLRYRRQKTETSGGVQIAMPVSASLLDILPMHAATFLATRSGEQRSAEGLGNLIKAACAAAGMPHLSSHGLRKACARRLSEAGSSDDEIMAVTGHRGHAMVSHYTRQASRAILAANAKEKMANHTKRLATHGD